MLRSLIRSGDRKRARKLLNRYLGAVFLQSPDLVVVRALMIEMLGYLVRTAGQDSAHLGFLIESSHRWTGRIIAARSNLARRQERPGRLYEHHLPVGVRERSSGCCPGA